MVEPKHDIVVIGLKVRPGHGDRLVGVVGEDGKRAGRIEAYATDGARVNLVLLKRALDGNADTSPNIVRGLFLVRESMSKRPSTELQRPICEAYIEVQLWCPEADIL